MEYKEKHFLKQIIIEKGDTSLVSLSINLMHMLDELLKGIKRWIGFQIEGNEEGWLLLRRSVLKLEIYSSTVRIIF